MPNYNDSFAANFNRVLGNQTGSVAVARPTKRQGNTGPTVNPKDILKKSGSSSSKKKHKSLPPHVIPKPDVKVADDPKNVQTALTHSFGRKGPLGFLERNVGEPLGNLVGRGVDIISRPDYAWTDAITKALQAAGEEGNIWSTGDDFIYGLRRGIQGHDKTGYQDVGHAFLANQDEIPQTVFGIRDFGVDWFSQANNEDTRQDLEDYLQNVEDIKAGRNPRHDLSWMEQPDPIGERPTGAGYTEQWSNKDRKDNLVKALGTQGWLGLTSDLMLSPTNLIGPVFKPTTVVNHIDDAGKVVKGVDATVAASSKAAKTAAAAKGADKTTLKLIEEALTSKVDDLVFEYGLDSRTLGDGRTLHKTLGATATNAYRDAKLAPLEDRIELLYKAKQAGNKAEYKRILQEGIQADPLFAQYVDNWFDLAYAKAMEGKVPRRKTAALKDNLLYDSLGDIDVTALADTRAVIDPDLIEFRKLFDEAMDGSTVRRGAIRMPSGNTVNVGPAKLYAAGGKLGTHLADGPLGRAFSYSRNFPGQTGMKAQLHRAGAIKRADEFLDRIMEGMPKLKNSEWKLVQNALRTGTENTLQGDLNVVANKIRAGYDELWQMEVDAGFRKGAPPKNYVYEWLQSGDSKQVSDYRLAKKKALNEGDANWAARADAEKGKARFLSENALQNLMYKTREVNRKLAQRDMYHDVISQYGVLAKDLSKEAAEKMNLVKVDENIISKLAKDQLQALKTPGVPQYFVDEEVAKVLDNFTKWSRNGLHPESNWMLRELDRFTNFVKQINTLYWPSFHFRNAIGDFIASMMDGVKVNDYVKSMYGWSMYHGPLKKDVMMKIGDMHIPFSKLESQYLTDASSHGFFRVEVPSRHISGFRGKAHAVNEKLRRASEAREDFSRFAHYVSAMEDELPRALDRVGGKFTKPRYRNPKTGRMAQSKTGKLGLEDWSDADKAFKQASKAATFRVNKYHVDYGALTHFEQNVMRRVIPFYTFMRRMTPVFMESFFTNPAYFTVGNKFERNMLKAFGGDKEEFEQRWDMPPWMKEVAAAQVNNKWVLAPNDLLPVGLLNRFMGQGSIKDNAGSILTSTNPFVTAGMNWQYGTDRFTGREGSTFESSVGNTLRPWTTIKSLFFNPDSDWTEKGVRTLGGVPAYKLSDKRKDSARQARLRDMQIYADQLSAEAPKGYKIYLGGKNSGTTGQKLVIATTNEDGSSKQTVVETTNVQVVLDWLEKHKD